jgi:hypothetical protein
MSTGIKLVIVGGGEFGSSTSISPTPAIGGHTTVSDFVASERVQERKSG